ncbi:MAG: hypothetical protein C4536_02140 [Actinobacteria bacterium]|jgi:hypothetical protein|nr:MAG: hypothetical protein C4536_02140 [Actinomycetota bacterium]
MAIALFVVVTVACLAGCGGGSGASDTSDAIALLMASTQAMSELSGYRMSGTVTLSSGDDAGGQSQPVSMEITADIQNADGEMRQHMFVTIGGYEVEAYIIGGIYYQNVPGQGWQKSSVGAYQAQGINLGLVGADQMELMAQMARDARVADDSDETVTISIHLDQEYFHASIDIYRDYIEEANEQMPEEWLAMVEEINDFQADMNISLRKADDLFQSMDMSYTMSGLTQVGTVSSSMQVDFFDYDKDIVVELPPEAAQAQEVVLSQ